MKKRTLSNILVLGLLAFFSSAIASAQEDYPSKTVVITTHTAPGGGMDIMARSLVEALKGQNISAVVENRPGGSGAVNLAYLASRPSDGYTLSTAGRAHLIARYIANLPHEFRDFKPVARIATEEYAIVSKAGGKWTSIADVIKEIKASPGQLKMGGGFIGTPDSLLAIGFFKELGVEPAFVPFEDASAINVAVLGDQLALAIVNPAEARAQIDSGQFKVLAVASEQRSPYFPDVPTLQESGVNVVGQQWRGVWAPKSTPDEIVNKAAEIIKTAMKESVFQKYMKDGMLVEAYLGPSEFQTYMEGEDKNLAQAIDELGLRGSQAK
jgi:tripartite-type tricarboxylate transporter receptor subunit TctC